MSTQIPKTIKAIQVDKVGGPEVNVLREIPTPVPKENEVLIKVQWRRDITVLTHFVSLDFRSGLYPVQHPYTVGQDAVGTLVQAPEGYPIKVGSRVFTTAGSAFAEYLVASRDRVAALPEDIDPKDGVSMATQGLTALYLLKESYPVKKGDWILNRAAAGGVGLILTQIAKYLGVNVIGTVSSQSKVETVKQSGADHVLLSSDSSESNVKKILELTGGQGVHAVYDGVGKDTWEEDFDVVRRKGTIVTYGNASGAVPPFPATKLSPKALKVTRPTLFAVVKTQEEWDEYTSELIDITKKAKIHYAVHKEYGYSAEDVIQAQKDIQGRGTTGKLLIKISE
nr:NADPH2:quinone reductase [Kwoniella mangroviensis CBS 8507]OCF65801.1 NADPH2:quinone reductase [Kwoniella mangroviensis CBS 8507]